MAKVVPFSNARARLTELLDEVERLQEHIVITRNGRQAVVVMAQPEYESLIETLEILNDDEAMDDLRQSDEDVKAGRVYDWKDVKRDLRLG